jgi:polyhydroxyalkanoate synthesis regulator phasin
MPDRPFDGHSPAGRGLAGRSGPVDPLEEAPMKKLLALAMLGAFGFVGAPAQAAENAQQERMKACNAEAGDKKGDERKAFMSDCLKKKKVSQQEKMKTCNVKAGEMKGDERKKFMSDCLKS